MPIVRIWLARSALQLALALNLTGCGTPLQLPPRPVQSPRVPPPPAELMEPPACSKCSESVEQLFKRWQRMLGPTRPA